jgi:hypothetical protein
MSSNASAADQEANPRVPSTEEIKLDFQYPQVRLLNIQHAQAVYQDFEDKLLDASKHNYQSWKRQITQALGMSAHFDYCEGIVPVPHSNLTTSSRNWKLNDRQARVFVENKLRPCDASEFATYTSAATLWTAIQKKYEHPGLMGLMALWRETLSFRLNINEPMDPQIEQMRTYNSRIITNQGEFSSDKQLIMIMLNSMEGSDAIVALRNQIGSILKDNATSTDVILALRQFESMHLNTLSFESAFFQKWTCETTHTSKHLQAYHHMRKLRTLPSL